MHPSERDPNLVEQICASRSQKNFASIVTLSTLSTVFACLAIFNLYLVAWIWVSLDSSVQMRPGEQDDIFWPRLDLLSSRDAIRFFGRLIARQTIEAKTIRANRRNQPQKSSEILHLVSSNSIHFQTFNGFQILRFVPQENRIEFSSGLSVHDQTGKSKFHLTCPISRAESQVAPKCKFSGTKRLRITNQNGLKIPQRTFQSIETPEIETNRLHSSTRKLHFRSLNAIRLSSFTGDIRATSLDQLILSSSKSYVSILS